MATITAAGNGNWSAGGTWNGGVVPGDGDTADLNGFVVAMDIPRIPATGTLASLTSPGKAGQLTVAMNVLGDAEIDVTGGSIIGGTVNFFILTSGAAPAATLTINGNRQAGSGQCVRHGSTAALVLNGNGVGGTGTNSDSVDVVAACVVVINGDLTGGSGNGAMGMRVETASGVTVNNANITGGSNATFGTAAGIYNISAVSVVLSNCNVIETTNSAMAGRRPTWNLGAANYYQLSSGVRLWGRRGDMNGGVAA